jgi:hypothetical protein
MSGTKPPLFLFIFMACTGTNLPSHCTYIYIYLCVCVCVCRWIACTLQRRMLLVMVFQKMLYNRCNNLCFLNLAGCNMSFIQTTSRSTILARGRVTGFSKDRNKPSCSITNPMEHEADMPSSPQVISYLLRKAVLYYQALNFTSLEPVLRRLTSVHTPTLTSVLIFSLMMSLFCNRSAISE